jgi:hypothetical protein
MTPVINKPKSSKTDKFSAALNPIIDQRKGMIKIYFDNFLSVKSNIPNVNIVVGQGSPNVGAFG